MDFQAEIDAIDEADARTKCELKYKSHDIDTIQVLIISVNYDEYKSKWICSGRTVESW